MVNEEVRQNNLVAHTSVLKNELASVLSQLAEAGNKIAELTKDRERLASLNETIKADNERLLRDQAQIFLDTNKFIEAAIEKVTESVKELGLTIQQNDGKIRQSQEDFLAFKSGIEEEISKSRKQLDRVKEDLQQALANLDAEREKISSPLEFLKAEEARLDQKRQDLDIYMSQVKRYWDKVFPGRELII